MSESTPPDAEQQRIDELLAAQTHGTATAAEVEELALYVAERPELQAQAERAAEDARLGKGWLERVNRDHQVQLAEQSPRANVERGVGLGLAGLGLVTSFINPIGVPILGIGGLVLLYSLVRVRLKTHKNDPYKDVIR